MSDTDEHSAERRHRQPGRRGSDAHAYTTGASFEVIDEDVRDIAVFLHKVQRGWKRWAAIGGVIVTIAGGTVGVMVWLGWTNSSPNQRFAAHDSTMRASVKDINNDIEIMRRTDIAPLVARVSVLEAVIPVLVGSVRVQCSLLERDRSMSIATDAALPCDSLRRRR